MTWLFEWSVILLGIWLLWKFVLSKDPWIRAKLNLDKLKARVELTEEERAAIDELSRKVGTVSKEEIERINQAYDVDLKNIQKKVKAAIKKGKRYGSED